MFLLLAKSMYFSGWNLTWMCCQTFSTANHHVAIYARYWGARNPVEEGTVSSKPWLVNLWYEEVKLQPFFSSETLYSSILCNLWCAGAGKDVHICVCACVCTRAHLRVEDRKKGREEENWKGKRYWGLMLKGILSQCYSGQYTQIST